MSKSKTPLPPTASLIEVADYLDARRASLGEGLRGAVTRGVLRGMATHLRACASQAPGAPRVVVNVSERVDPQRIADEISRRLSTGGAL